jgi:hypothetical protein
MERMAEARTTKHPIEILELGAALDAIASDASLREPLEYSRRLQAIESVDSCILERIDSLLAAGFPPRAVLPLQRNAETVIRQLRWHDSVLLEEIRREIREGALRGARFLSRLEACGFDLRDARHRTGGYDGLDALVSDLLLHDLEDDAIPDPRRALEAEMVQYQPTPARVVLALIAHARVARDDVFFDIGSGLGQVPMLVNLLTGARAIGVELEPAYCEYARRRVVDLNLEDVVFRNDDARAADYGEGTVFFLYTPVKGEMLQVVLDRIRARTCNRKIRVLTYGPCTDTVASLTWLTSTDSKTAGLERIGAFVSRQERITD